MYPWFVFFFVFFFCVCVCVLIFDIFYIFQNYLQIDSFLEISRHSVVSENLEH